MLRATYTVQGMSCASCAQTVKKAIKDNAEKVAVDPISGRTVALVPDKATALFIESLITESGFDAELLELLPVAAQELYTVRASIGGITCAACANTIKRITDGLDFVENSQIDVLTGSAQFSITNKANEPVLAAAIDDAGYDYTLIAIEHDKNVQEHTKTRTITLEIKGMHCQRCPDTVMRILRSYGDVVEIENPVSLEYPTVRFTYIPLPPKFGIRSIVGEIEAQTLGLRCEAVEPMSPEQAAHENRIKEMADITRRLRVALIFSVPALMLMFMPMYMMSMPGKLLMMVMATPVYFYSAAVFHKHALPNLRSAGFLNFGSMNLLMSLGTSISYWASLILLLVDPHADSYFDSVIFLTLFLLMGRYLDLYSKAKTATAVSSITALRPVGISVKEIDNFLTVPAWKVDVGDTVRVIPGSRVGVDGTILGGTSQFDEATLTGESRPVPKSKGDQVYSGTVNSGNEAVVVRALAVDKGTLLDGIVDAVRQGQLVRANIERFSDTITALFVPVVIYLAFAVWFAWYIAGELGYVPRNELDKCHCGWVVFAMEFAVAMFVVACPCGVGLAAPTALYVGASVAAKYGIISRGGGEAFEEASKVDIVCFDKTGTITNSKPVITDVYFPELLVDVDSHDHDELVQLAARMEDESSHPLAMAVKNYSVANVRSSRVENVRAVAGRGIKANICAGPLEGKEAILGNEQLVWESNMQISRKEQCMLKKWKSQGSSVIILCVDSKVVMMMAATDEIRSEAISAIADLQRRNIDCWMVSGDNFETARAVAKQVGIPVMNVIAQVLPEEKANKVKWLQQTGMSTTRHDGRAIVAMVGDGVNDAPALAVSDVGIAMGSGADITLNTAKFVLVHGDISGVPLTLDLSSAVMRKVKLNYLWAGLYNMIAVPIAAGILYPWTGYRLDPVFASLAMCLSSLSVMANSLLLKGYKYSIKRGHVE